MDEAGMTYPDRLSLVCLVEWAGLDHFQSHPGDLVGMGRALFVQAARHAVRITYCFDLTEWIIKGALIFHGKVTRMISTSHI